MQIKFRPGNLNLQLRIRFCDASTVDVAQLREALAKFMSRISGLFVQRKAHSIQGYTQFAPGLHSLCLGGD